MVVMRKSLICKHIGQGGTARRTRQSPLTGVGIQLPCNGLRSFFRPLFRLYAQQIGSGQPFGRRPVHAAIEFPDRGPFLILQRNLGNLIPQRRCQRPGRCPVAHAPGGLFDVQVDAVRA